MNENTSRWVIVVVVLLFLGFFGIIMAGILSLAFIGADDSASMPGNVAVIPLTGVIFTGGGGGFLDESIASSSQIVEWIQKADANPSVKAIILEINSPGGAPVATDEIAHALKMTNKTTVAWIREMGASGAYWAASACDHIVANRMSMTGSIGVRGSYLEFSGLLKRYNITYEELHAGEFKETGSPWRKMTEEERAKLLETIDRLHGIFITEVSKNRGIPYEEAKKLATGEVFLGVEALENRLIDALGGKAEAIDYIEDELDIKVEEMRFTRPVRFVDVLRGLTTDMSNQIGKGIGSEIMDQDEPRIQVR